MSPCVPAAVSVHCNIIKWWHKLGFAFLSCSRLWLKCSFRLGRFDGLCPPEGRTLWRRCLWTCSRNAWAVGLFCFSKHPCSPTVLCSFFYQEFCSSWYTRTCKVRLSTSLGGSNSDLILRRRNTGDGPVHKDHQPHVAGKGLAGPGWRRHRHGSFSQAGIRSSTWDVTPRSRNRVPIKTGGDPTPLGENPSSYQRVQRRL